jgi:hypothetical protein
VACLSTLIAAFYTVENWRGKRAWERCKRTLEAKGEVLDWNAYIPPPVPSDQNIFEAPKVRDWLVGRGASELSRKFTNAATGSVGSVNVITNKEEADAYIEWSDKLEPDFNLIREALRRPYARIDGDYDQPFAVPLPNFVALRGLAQTLAQRTHCYLLLRQPEAALRDLTLLRDLTGLLEAKPTGKPMTLVAAMINVAITGLYTAEIADGLQMHAWREPQLVAIQEQLRGINLAPVVAEAFRNERAAVTHTVENTLADKIADQHIAITGGKTNFWERLKTPLYSYLTFAPRGWVYQNMAVYSQMVSKYSDCFANDNREIVPRLVKQSQSDVEAALRKKSPYYVLARIAVPNASKAVQTLARNQTLANEAFVACALERYKLAHGNYPETLDALVPRFAKGIPHDVVGSRPLKYRCTSDGQFALYSIGWNETDDDGVVVTNENGSLDVENGDWVWGRITR